MTELISLTISRAILIEKFGELPEQFILSFKIYGEPTRTMRYAANVKDQRNATGLVRLIAER